MSEPIRKPNRIRAWLAAFRERRRIKKEFGHDPHAYAHAIQNHGIKILNDQIKRKIPARFTVERNADITSVLSIKDELFFRLMGVEFKSVHKPQQQILAERRGVTLAVPEYLFRRLESFLGPVGYEIMRENQISFKAVDLPLNKFQEKALKKLAELNLS